MKLPQKDTMMRIGYGLLGSATAVGWNKVLSVKVEKGAYIPPSLICASLVFSENTGSVEKDLATAALGYMATAQAISFLSPGKKEAVAKVSAAPNPSEAEATTALVSNQQNLEKIQAVSQALGSVLGIISQFRSPSK